MVGGVVPQGLPSIVSNRGRLQGDRIKSGQIRRLRLSGRVRFDQELDVSAGRCCVLLPQAIAVVAPKQWRCVMPGAKDLFRKYCAPGICQQGAVRERHCIHGTVAYAVDALHGLPHLLAPSVKNVARFPV
jgi:hypothetical protein